MKELQDIRNKILFLRNMKVISKQAETELLNTLNNTEAVIKSYYCIDKEDRLIKCEKQCMHCAGLEII
jgi:hypothetical protein